MSEATLLTREEHAEGYALFVATIDSHCCKCSGGELDDTMCAYCDYIGWFAMHDDKMFARLADSFALEAKVARLEKLIVVARSAIHDLTTSHTPCLGCRNESLPHSCGKPSAS